MTESQEFSFKEANDIEETVAEEQQIHIRSVDCTLFVIDASTAMRQANKYGEIPFLFALRCASTVLLDKLPKSNTERIGILFYGTLESSNKEMFEHIYLLQDLEESSAEQVKQLEVFTKNPQKIEQIVGQVATTDSSLSDVLKVCQNVFPTSEQYTGTKRIFLMTNNATPYASQPESQQIIHEQISSLYSSGIRIELFQLSSLDPRFDPLKFYKTILSKHLNDADNDHSDMWREMPVSNQYKELLIKVKRRMTKKRAQMQLPFALTDRLTIGVSIYKLLDRQNKQKSRPFYFNDGFAYNVQSKTELVIKNTDTHVDKDQVHYYYMFGGEKVVFTKQELEQMITFGEPGIRLLGFKPQNSLKLHHTVSPPYFAYPDEATYQGSITTFTALLRTLAEKKYVAICRLIMKKYSGPRLVALLPQLEVVDDYGQVEPPGFHIITLPFSDAIRHIPVNTPIEASEEQIDLVKRIISKLALKQSFQADMFNNPVIQRHNEVLKAVALGRDIPEPANKILKYTKGTSQRIGDLVRQFKSQIDLDHYVFLMKRKAEYDADGNLRVNKTKKDGVSHDHILQLARMNKVNQLTVEQLKGYLHGISKQSTNNTKKAELVARVMQAVKPHL
ncbi:SPOC like C-terminal domain-containing protein [Syncephalis fuscata]|nr:SPOC like C-terminal domain-containing protein [Syncephalis fuscata]